jgi:3-methylfumaryl-CoA hydratase
MERISEAPVLGLCATLDRNADASAGMDLPPLWHWLYGLPRAAQRDIGADGHPRVGGFLPPVPLPRRMWAGSRVAWRTPLLVGDEVQRTSTVAAVSHKAGRSGDLVFVLVRHEWSSKRGIALSEDQDIVYRAAAQPGDPTPALQPAPADAIWSREIVPDPVLLFRYSALTFNGHRIHYDRPYATQVEGYPGLVVHGPLLATLLMDLARRECLQARFSNFSFKAVRPMHDLHPFRVCGKPSADGRSALLWVQDHEGWVTMQAEVLFDRAGVFL